MKKVKMHFVCVYAYRRVCNKSFLAAHRRQKIKFVQSMNLFYLCIFCRNASEHLSDINE